MRTGPTVAIILGRTRIVMSAAIDVPHLANGGSLPLPSEKL